MIVTLLTILVVLLLLFAAVVTILLWRAFWKNKALELENTTLIDTMSESMGGYVHKLTLQGYSGYGEVMADKELIDLVAVRDEMRTRNFKEAVKEEINKLQIDQVGQKMVGSRRERGEELN